MTPIRIVLALIILATAAHPADAQENANAAAAADFAARGMSATVAACHLPHRCGGKPPRAMRKQVRETGNDTLIDYRELTFDGLDIEMLYVLGDKKLAAQQRPQPHGKPTILSVKVSSAAWPVAHGLRVGSARSAVEAVLGQRANEAECANYVNMASQDEVVICYADRKVRTIMWTKWWDG